MLNFVSKGINNLDFAQLKIILDSSALDVLAFPYLGVVSLLALERVSSISSFLSSSLSYKGPNLFPEIACA